MVPADSAMVRALLECDSLGQVRIKQLETENGLRLKQNLSLKGNLLMVGAEIDSLAVYLAYKATYELKQSKSNKVEQSNSETNKKVTVGDPWWWIILKWLGVVVGVIFTGIYFYSKFSISSFFK